MFILRKRPALPLLVAKRLFRTSRAPKGLSTTFLLAKLSMQPFEVDRHGTQLQVLANSLCRHIEQRKGPDGTTVWANLEGHTLLDDISSLRRELQSMRAVISRLEAENGSRKAENHKLQIQVFAQLRLRYLASFLNVHRQDVWVEMGGDYERDIDPVNAVAHEGDMATDVALYHNDLMEELHVRAFTELYDISVEQASEILQYPKIVECFDKLATLRGHGHENSEVRRDFLAAVRGVTYEKLHELDRAVDVEGGAEDVISQTLRFLRQKVHEQKEKRKQRLLAAQAKKRNRLAPISD